MRNVGRCYTMSLAPLLDSSLELTFAVVVKKCDDEERPWAICNQMDVRTLRPMHPSKCLYVSSAVLKGGMQFFRIGPFFTPFSVSLEKLPVQVGDIVLGATSTNHKGPTFVTLVHDRWARPIAHFFFFLWNKRVAAQLYENPSESKRISLLTDLRVQYEAGLDDERLYDILLLLLFDNTDALLNMCRRPEFRPAGSRTWDLSDADQNMRVQEACQRLKAGDSTSANKNVYVPNVAEFVEETAVLLGDSGCVTHFRACLKVAAAEEPEMWLPCVQDWLNDKDHVLNAELIDSLSTARPSA